jgi:ribonuclease-3
MIKEEETNINNINETENIHIINPYNSRNKYLRLEDVNIILKNNNIEEKIEDITLWQKALTHKSYIKKNIQDTKTILAQKPENCIDLFDKSNETLEYLGDSIIGNIVANYLYERFPDKNEGFMTKMRTKLVCGNQLAIFSKSLGLNELYLISNHVEDRCNGRENKRIMEDVFESFIGSMYLYFNNKSLNQYNLLKKEICSLKHYNVPKEKIKLLLACLSKFDNLSYGYSICNKFIRNLLENEIDWSDLITIDENFKDQILKYFQHHFKTTPKYEFSKEEGPPNDRIFTMTISDQNGKLLGSGTANTKKKAEQIASKNALIKLGIIIT